MATTPVRSRAQWATLAKQARAAGLTKYDSRNLNNGQKAHLSKLANNHSDILSNPEKYTIKHVKARTLKAVKTAALPEFKVINGKVFAKKHDKRTPKKEHIHIGSNKAGEMWFTREHGAKKTGKTHIRKNPLDVFKDIKRKEKRLLKLQALGRRGLMGARFGDKEIALSFDSAEEMEKYLSAFSSNQLKYISIIVYDMDEEEE